MPINKGYTFFKSLRLILSAATLLASGYVFAGEITVEGAYYGKNVFVQNPYSGSTGFCVTEVTVNGKVTTDEIQQSSFEVDLSALQLVVGQKVTIKIKHKDGCKPKVVNTEDLKPRATFEVVAGSMKVSKDGKFSFTTQGESGKLPFIVEHYRWNKWVKVAEVQGIGTPEQHYYEVKYTGFSGENKIRVKQVDVTGAKVSTPIKYRSMSPVVTFKQEKDGNITFTSETKYEVFDKFGNVVLQGFGSSADVSGLKKGVYYINYDNKTGDTFTKN